MGITEDDYELLIFGLIPVGRIEHEWWNSTTMVYGYLCTISMLLFWKLCTSSHLATVNVQLWLCDGRLWRQRDQHQDGDHGDMQVSSNRTRWRRYIKAICAHRKAEEKWKWRINNSLSLTSAGARISHSSWCLFPATSSHQTPLLLGRTSANPAGCWNLTAVQRHNSKPNQWHTQALHILTTEKYQIQNVRSNSAYTEVLTKVDE